MGEITDYITGFILPTPKVGWQEGEEGVDYLDITDKQNETSSMMADIMDVALTTGFPGTQILALLPLAAGLLLIPLKWIICGIEVELWDLLFSVWLTYLLPIPSISILGFGCPVPIGLIVYWLTKDLDFPLFGDGTIIIPHSGNATYFGGHTDGKFTCKDAYLDGFILWTLYKGMKYFGREIVAAASRVIFWAAAHRKVSVKDVLNRLKSQSLNLTFLTGYQIQDGEETLHQLLTAVEDEIETEEDTGIKAKEYIKKIKKGLNFY